jgi:uncharacterized protein YbcI
MVGMLRESLGKGPARAQTFIHECGVFCLLEETMTPVERTLHDESRDETVAEIREALHQTMKEPAMAKVEELTGRRVLAFLSDHHRSPDVGLLAFVLEREGAQLLAADEHAAEAGGLQTGP